MELFNCSSEALFSASQGTPLWKSFERITRIQEAKISPKGPERVPRNSILIHSSWTGALRTKKKTWYSWNRPKNDRLYYCLPAACSRLPYHYRQNGAKHGASGGTDPVQIKLMVSWLTGMTECVVMTCTLCLLDNACMYIWAIVCDFYQTHASFHLSWLVKFITEPHQVKKIKNRSWIGVPWVYTYRESVLVYWCVTITGKQKKRKKKINNRESYENEKHF